MTVQEVHTSSGVLLLEIQANSSSTVFLSEEDK